jgi:hypothetical protein
MELPATPEFVISQMRMQTMREITYFCVTNQPTPFVDLDKDFDPMLGKLDAAWAQANLGKVTAEVRTDIIRYYKADEPNLWQRSTSQDAAALSLCGTAAVGPPGAHRAGLRRPQKGHAGSGTGTQRRESRVGLLL